jgi:hypothetical protein
VANEILFGATGGGGTVQQSTALVWIDPFRTLGIGDASGGAISFNRAVVGATIGQATAAAGNGNALSISTQAPGGGGTVSGALNLATGTAATPGHVLIQPGNVTAVDVGPTSATLTPATGTTFSVAMPSATSGKNLQINSGVGTSGAGGFLGLNAGSGTTAGGAVTVSGGDATAATGTGGGVTVNGGAGNTSGTAGTVKLVGGDSGSTGAAGNVVLQAGQGSGPSQNGSVQLVDGNFALALAVRNGLVALDAPLNGDTTTNDPLRFGLASPVYPTVNTTYTLLNTEYAKFTIRPTGTATPASGPVIVFPDVAGGYTKMLDLTQVIGISAATELVLKAGAGAGAKTTAILHPTPSVYIVSYDGTTLSVSQYGAPSGSLGQTTNPGPVAIGSSFAALPITQTITVGLSGKILATFNGQINLTRSLDQVDFEFQLDGVAQPLTTKSVNSQSPSLIIVDLSQTWLFSGLIPGSSHNVDVLMRSNITIPPDHALNSVLVLQSP